MLDPVPIAHNTVEANPPHSGHPSLSVLIGKMEHIVNTINTVNKVGHQMITTNVRYLRNFISNLEEHEVVSFIKTQDHWGRIGQKRRLSFWLGLWRIEKNVEARTAGAADFSRAFDTFMRARSDE